MVALPRGPALPREFPIHRRPGTHGGLEFRLGEVGDQRWALTRGGLGGPAAGRSH